jgi:protein-tyrosine phosphatase
MEEIRRCTYSSASGIKFHHFPISDGMAVDITSYFNPINTILNSVRESKERVLVHCQAGVSRSATVVIAYLLHSERTSLSSTLARVKAARKWIEPNWGFVYQLGEYEKTILNVLEPSVVLSVEQKQFVDAQIERRRKRLAGTSTADMTGASTGPSVTATQSSQSMITTTNDASKTSTITDTTANSTATATATAAADLAPPSSASASALFVTNTNSMIATTAAAALAAHATLAKIPVNTAGMDTTQ